MASTGQRRSSIPSKPSSNPAGLLTKHDITRLGLISENFSDKCLRPTSYDLRLGEEFMSPSRDDGTSQFLLGSRPLEIPKFSSVIICTHEIVKLPSNVAANFNLKIKMALRGLFVQMGTQVEPNYNGRLFALLQNITDEPIILTPKDDDCRLLAIQFFYTSAAIRPDENDFVPGKIIERIGQFITSSPIKGTINNITSDMEKDIEELKGSHETFSRGARDTEERIEVIASNVAEASTRIFQWKTILIGGTLFAGLSILVAVVAPIITKVLYDGMTDTRFEAVNETLQNLSARVDGLSSSSASATGQDPLTTERATGENASKSADGSGVRDESNRRIPNIKELPKGAPAR